MKIKLSIATLLFSIASVNASMTSSKDLLEGTSDLLKSASNLSTGTSDLSKGASNLSRGTSDLLEGASKIPPEALFPYGIQPRK